MEPHLDELAVARVAKLCDEAADADTVAKAAHERRDRAIREACDQGWTPRTLQHAGVALSSGSMYRILGTAS